MNKKIWFYLCMVCLVILLGIIILICLNMHSPVKVEYVDLSEFLEQFHPTNNFAPAEGYIPDAETAKVVGARIIDNLTGNHDHLFNGVEVKYDQTNRLWYISKGYLFSPGGFVVIEQDTGKIIKALLQK